MSNGIFQQLVQTPLFAGLDELESAVLFGIADQQVVRQGATLCNEGDPGDSLYVLLEGTVEVLKKDASGTQQSLAKLARGAVIGEMSLLSESPRSASILAITDLKLMRIPCSRFHRLLAEDSLPALKVVRNLAQLLTKRLAGMSDRLVEVLDGGKRKEELVSFQRILTEWQF